MHRLTDDQLSDLLSARFPRFSAAELGYMKLHGCHKHVGDIVKLLREHEIEIIGFRRYQLTRAVMAGPEGAAIQRAERVEAKRVDAMHTAARAVLDAVIAIFDARQIDRP